MMQKNCDRISAQPNTKAYGSNVAVQYYTWLPRLLSCLIAVFVPAPNVDSAILKMVHSQSQL